MSKTLVTASLVFFTTSLVGVVAVMMPRVMTTKNTLGASVQSTATPATSAKKMITQDELATHDSAESCWIQIDQSVYDVTNFLDKHPGGRERLLQFCGKDATNGYATKGDEQESHSKTADGIKRTQLIGEISL